MNHDPERDIDPPESTDIPERDFERDPLSLAYIDAQVQQVNHDFPLDIRIKGLLAEIDETCRVPVQETIDVLHAMLAFIDESEATTKAISAQIDSFIENLQSKTFQGNQA